MKREGKDPNRKKLAQVRRPKEKLKQEIARDIADDSHDWTKRPTENYEFCLACGNIRRADRKNSRCKGPTRIVLR